jgi:hypothetical protein
MRVENLMFTERGVRQNINLCFGVYVLAFLAFMVTERTQLQEQTMTWTLIPTWKSHNICKILDLSKSHLTRETHSIIKRAIASPRLIRPITTKRNTLRINSGRIQTMIIHGLTVLIAQRVRIIEATECHP